MSILTGKYFGKLSCMSSDIVRNPLKPTNNIMIIRADARSEVLFNTLDRIS